MTNTPSADIPSARNHPWLLLVALAALALFGIRTITHGSFWMHLASGRLIATRGIPTADPFSFTTTQERVWVNNVWLHDLVLYRLWSLGGATATTLFTVLCAVAAFALLAGVARRWTSPGAAAFVLLIGAAVVAPAFVVGGAMPAALLFSAFLALLAHGRRPLVLLLSLPIVQAIWTNLHPSFVCGPVLALAFAGDGWLGRNRAPGPETIAPPWRISAGIALVVILATLLNPYGLAMHRYAIALGTNTAYAVLTEWISPFHGEFDSTWFTHAGKILLVLVAAGFVFIRHRLPLVLAGLAVAGAFLEVLSPRYVVFSTAMMIPFACISLQAVASTARASLAPRLAETLHTGTRLAIATLAVIIALHVATNAYYARLGSASVFGFGTSTDTIPAAAADRVLSRPDFPTRAVNLPEDGGYLAWRFPDRKIFTDSRVTVYGAAFYQGLSAGLLGQEQTWTNLLARFEPEAVILNASWPGSGAAARRLLEDKHWALVYFDGATAVIVARSTATKALISDLEVQAEGLIVLEESRRAYETALNRGLRHPGNPPRLIGGGNIFLALGKLGQAETVYTLLARGAPTFATAWLSLGICRHERGDFEGAIAALNRAKSIREYNALAWLWLYRALESAGRPEDSKAALERARRLNTPLTTAFTSAATLTNAPTLLPSEPR